MNYRTISLFFIIVLATLSGVGQQSLREGDRLPAYFFNQVLNHNGLPISTEDLAGKALILDFWTPYCAPCINEMPYLDSLQQEFGDQLQIIPVVTEISPAVDRLIARWMTSGYVHRDVLPFPKDTTLYKSFTDNNNWLGQHTWIDKAGRIRYFSTGKEFLSRQNIAAFLAGEPVAAIEEFMYKRRQTQVTAAQFSKQVSMTMAAGQETMNSRPMVSSFLTNWQPSMGSHVPSTIRAHMPGRVIRASGVSLLKLYSLAYGDTLDSYATYMRESSYGKLWGKPLIEVSNKTPFQTGESPTLYYYYQCAPDTITDARKLQAIIQANLGTCFGYHVEIQTRPMPCWELVVTDPAKIPYSITSTVQQDQSNTTEINLLNWPVQYLIWRLYNAFPLADPFIDRSGISRNISLSIPYDGSFDALTTQLGSFGLGLRKATTPMRVIVIKD